MHNGILMSLLLLVAETTRKIEQVIVSANEASSFLFHICFFDSVVRIVTKVNQIR